MKLNNRFIFGILSLVLAAVIAFVALPTIARQTNGKTEIVRITQPVLKGEQVTKENAEVVEVGGYNLPTNVAHSLEDVEGLYVTADLAAGDYILTSKVSSVPISSDVALNDIPSGKVAISLTVKTLASGLSDKLQPNDIVRIYHFLETAEEVPELRFVKVLSVTDSDGINVDNTKEPTEDEEPQQSATITVLASPEQARIITELENDGVAHVALISRNNDQLAEELLAEQDKTLQEIYFPETLTEDGENEGTDATGDPASAEDSGENTHRHLPVIHRKAVNETSLIILIMIIEIILPHNQGHSALGKGVSYGKSHYRLGQPRERKKYVFLHSGKSPDPRQAESDHHQCGNQCSYASGVAAGADHSDQCLCRAGTEQRGNRYLFGGRACYRAQKLSLHWSDGLCCR
jgi:Flp pilus assembly protein CpaB